MANPMRTNSIISDPAPYIPALSGNEKKQTTKAPPNDFEKIAKSDDYPQFAHYIQSRIDYFSQFTPAGTPVENLSEAERSIAWGQASAVIREMRALKDTLETYRRQKNG